MLIKQEYITSQKLGSGDFWQIANSVLSKGKSAIPHLFNGLEVLSSASDSKNSNLDDSGISLPVFPSRTHLKLHNISLTFKIVKKVIMNLNLSKGSGAAFLIMVSNVFEKLVNDRMVQTFLIMVSNVFKKLVNDRIVDHLEKCGLFSDFKYGFRSSWSTADLLTVVPDRIARALNRSGATWADGIWYIQGFWQGLACCSTPQT